MTPIEQSPTPASLADADHASGPYALLRLRGADAISFLDSQLASSRPFGEQ